MSWWELRARIAGFKAANTVTPAGEPEAKVPTPAQFDAVVARFADV